MLSKFKYVLPDRHKTLIKGDRRFNLLEIFRIIVNKYTHKISSDHLAKFPQLAIFAFDHIGLTINIDGRFENKSLLIVKKFLENLNYGFSKTIALDIGANIGNHSVFFSEIFKDVYAFEPNPYTYELLKINSIFVCPKKNIKIRNYGLSNKNKNLAFNMDFNNIGGSAIVNNVKSPVGKNIRVPVKKLDSLEELRNKKISLIKIDVEGHELEVLLGGDTLIKKNYPIILFEQQQNEIINGTSPVLSYLNSLDYNFGTIEENFYFGENYVQKLLSVFFRMLFGSQLRIVKRLHFKPRFYDMIIAFPNKKKFL
jgi:FkbM family methyltransferase